MTGIAMTGIAMKRWNRMIKICIEVLAMCLAMAATTEVFARAPDAPAPDGGTISTGTGIMGAGVGTGCEKRLKEYCPQWKSQSVAACLKCVQAHMRQLKPNCTRAKAEKKCHEGPSPSPGPVPPQPPAPLSPPTPPAPGAPRPHIVLFVVDDQVKIFIGRAARINNLF